MKKAILVLAPLIATIPLSAQTAGPPLAGPPRDGTSQVTPSMNDQIGDARGSEMDRALNQQTPVKPEHDKRGTEAPPSVSPSGAPDPVTLHEPNVPLADNSEESLDSTAFGKRLSTIRLNGREDVLTELDRRLAATQNEVEQLKQASVRLSGPNRDAFNAAYSEWKSRQKNLRKEEQAAREASPENWEQIRQALGNEYEAYVVSMTRVESASAYGL